ncbi:hypothetical protein PV325_000199 [Microctonus aethiopoides]|nr:hypothetical protein PV325_000199 [Microctonus aethiopoides]
MMEESMTTSELMTNAIWNLTELTTSSSSSSSSTFHVSSTDAAYRIFGARRDAMHIVLPVTIIYLLIFLTGTIGNVSTCIIIVRNKSMHTATNYYLFSLAVSDLLLLISGLPAEIYLVWSKYPYVFGEEFCIIRGLAAECSANASVLTITAFTAERYVAICHPFLSHKMSKLSRAIKLILIIWLVASCFAIPQALQFGIVEHLHISPDAVVCTLKTIVIQHSFEMSTLLFFFMPMTVITVLYVMIGIKLKKSDMMKKRNMRNQGCGGTVENRKKRWNCRHQTEKSSRRVLKMLVAVVVAFFICWAPFHVQRLIAIYGTGSDHVTSKSKWMQFLYILFTYLSGVMYYVSTTINPILYNIMSNKFREAFRETLSKSCGGVKSSGEQNDQRSFSSPSRSHQRNAGNFGSRSIMTGGTAIARDCSECSGHSGRDETRRQSSLVVGDSEVMSKLLTKELNRVADAESTSLTADNTSRIDLIPIRKLSPIEQSENAQVYKDNDRDNNDISKTIALNGDAARIREASYFGISTNGYEKKWWTMFKWIPGTKVFKLTNRQINHGESVMKEVESNQEEYSMTTCYVANGGGEQRLV